MFLGCQRRFENRCVERFISSPGFLPGGHAVMTYLKAWREPPVDWNGAFGGWSLLSSQMSSSFGRFGQRGVPRPPHWPAGSSYDARKMGRPTFSNPCSHVQSSASLFGKTVTRPHLCARQMSTTFFLGVFDAFYPKWIPSTTGCFLEESFRK